MSLNRLDCVAIYPFDSFHMRYFNAKHFIIYVQSNLKIQSNNVKSLELKIEFPRYNKR